MGKKAAMSEGELAAKLAEELRGAFRRVRRRMREQGAGGDLTPSQVSVLHRLEQAGAETVSELARAEGVRPQSMSAIVASLQEAGLVDAKADAHDGRKMLMSLSKRCEKMLATSRAARQDWLTMTIGQRLTAKEQKKLLAAMELLNLLAEE